MWALIGFIALIVVLALTPQSGVALISNHLKLNIMPKVGGYWDDCYEAYQEYMHSCEHTIERSALAPNIFVDKICTTFETNIFWTVY